MLNQAILDQNKTFIEPQNLLNFYLARGASFAWWRLPQEQNAHLLIDFSGLPEKAKPIIEEMGTGFLISPFINPELEESILLQADILLETTWRDDKMQINVENLPPLSVEALKKEAEQNNFAGNLQWHFNSNSAPASSLKEEYTFMVEKAVENIKKGILQKVVPSRIKKMGMSKTFDLVDNFQRLCLAYPNAMVVCYSVPELGTWLAATPETLIKVDQEGIFKTIALAGTQAIPEGKQIAEISWTQKEIEEQALVSRYIINCFKHIRLREFDEYGPRTSVAGNLIHLKTEFTVDTLKTGFPTLATTMLALLHPTSAVSGMPRQEALDFIMEHEKHPRELFSGFIGPVNVKEGSHLFVNLRCMQIKEKEIILYAGAGVTEDSSPEKEWNETELKCETLLSVIRI